VTSRLLNNAFEHNKDQINKVINTNRTTIFKIANICHIIILIALISVLNLNFGYQVNINGKNLGIVSQASIAENIIFEAYDAIVAVKGDEYKFDRASYNLVIANKNTIINSDLLKNNIVAEFDGLVSAYGISIDGTIVTALTEKSDANLVIETLTKQYLKQQSAKFTNQIDIISTRVDLKIVTNIEDAIKILNGTKDAVLTHTVENNESFSSIALKYGVSTDSLINANPNIVPERLQLGQKILVSAAVPLVSVGIVEKITIVEKIPYDVKEQNDSTLYKGVKKVLVEGKSGEKQVVYEVAKLNGKIKKSTVLSQKILKEPEAEVVAVGTKVKPKTAPTGSLLRPYYGSVSSRFGYRRGGMHTGIDYCGNVGDPIKAADGGTVVSSGWGGGYGKIVKISHGNGYETWYAHMSSINVKPGQKVAKGELIGKVGNTGNSTGPHLHFEVRKNGAPQNPSSFVR
jgi:murein DD-endopeptidase MepM/ murein hydrolase activator NlpD